MQKRKENKIMKGTRFLGIRTTLVVCILALVLVTEAGFISVAWAKKPPQGGKPPKTTTSYGYAKLTDEASYVIQSDDGRQYIDKNIDGVGGEDMVEIETDNKTGELVRSNTILGAVDDPYYSSRRVNFLFDIANGARLIEYPKAVYDILINRGTPDGAVHLAVMYRVSESHVDDVAFIIDPGWNGTDPDAITQDALNDFCSDDTDENYRTTDYGHVIYYLGYPSYPNPGCITPVPVDIDTWTITCSGPVTLYVMRTSGGGKGKGNRYDKMDLATYGELPFKLTMSLESLNIQTAPRKYNTLSISWGRMKAK